MLGPSKHQINTFDCTSRPQTKLSFTSAMIGTYANTSGPSCDRSVPRCSRCLQQQFWNHTVRTCQQKVFGIPIVKYRFNSVIAKLCTKRSPFNSNLGLIALTTGIPRTTNSTYAADTNRASSSRMRPQSVVLSSGLSATVRSIVCKM